MKTLNSRAAALALLLALLLLTAGAGPACAEKASGQTDRFNVVLVVDKSGSLCGADKSGTDPDGLRFDALRLFLGLLTESGNNVGAVVFDEQIRYECDPIPTDGMEQKKALIHEIESFTPSYDTDIGSAVKRATELLAKMRSENDLPCMILLFSDGMTDFTGPDAKPQMLKSYQKAIEGLAAAVEGGVTINSVFLNADGRGASGEVEHQLYTFGTGGQFVEVGSPEELMEAFKLFYYSINRTQYTGAQRIWFSDRGEAEISFAVPSFGVEEVNVVVEGAQMVDEKSGEARVGLEISSPAGDSFDLDDHDLACSRFVLAKIPHPSLGIWTVRLTGQPEDWADITMVYNASMSVALESDRGAGTYTAYRPYQFTAALTDTGVDEVTMQQLMELDAVLCVENLVTGAVQEYAMEPVEGGYSCEASFTGGEFAVSAAVGLGDFKVCSEPLEVTVETRPLIAKVSSVTDMLSSGRFADDCWELELDELFSVTREANLHYALSDDCGGALTVEDGVLRARFSGEETASFVLTATDSNGQSADIRFDLTIPAVAAKTDKITSMTKQGRIADGFWEVELDTLFDDPKGCALRYALSDDYDGALAIEDGVLRMDIGRLSEADFTVTAEDIFDRRAELPVSVTVPGPAAVASRITETVKTGLFQKGVWEVRVDTLFKDPMNSALRYELSDDLGGAASLENGVLRVNCKGLKTADFTVTATNAYNRSAQIPVTLTEKNVTIYYVLQALLVLFGISIPVGLIVWLRRR